MSKKKKEKPAKRGKSKCFRCDGTGTICNECGESEGACKCDAMSLDDCPDCKGTGK